MTQPNEPSEALQCWETMIAAGVPIGGEWIAVRVAHTNDLHEALATQAASPTVGEVERLREALERIASASGWVTTMNEKVCMESETRQVARAALASKGG